MATDELLREGVRQNLARWVDKLECGGDLEQQHYFKKRFIERLRRSPIAIDTDKANEQHYEVPTEFFLTVLGKRMKYSGCFWPEGTSSLEEAEDKTLALYCERARVKDGQDILDLGCGWGSLGLYILEKFPACRVTCLSNSATQRILIVDRARQMGMSSRLHAITANAITFSTEKQFDRIVSIEMFEHMKNYDTLFQHVSSWLRPNGLLFLQILCHKKHPYAFDVKPDSDTEWMAKNFFTGGTMPSQDLYLFFQKHISLLDSWVMNGKNYSRTLDSWLHKMDANKDKVAQIFSLSYGSDVEQKVRNWRLFFIFTSEVFGYRDGNEWHIAQQLFEKKLTSSM